MSKKQMRTLILIIVAAVIVVGGVVAALFLFDTSGGEVDNEQAKINGGIEIMKSDLKATIGSLKDSQAATIANTFFDKIGIEKYESIESGALRGNTTVYCDGYRFDCNIVAGELQNAYIGNVVVYKNTKSGTTTVANALEYSYKQYKTLVNSVIKGLKVEDAVGKQIYSDLTLMGINSFTNIKSGKLDGIQGFYGYESEMQYFLTVDGDSIGRVYVVCDGFDPIEVYNKTTGKPEYELSNVKVLYGARQGVANVLAYKIKQATELEVILPAALLNGDDSWLMVKKDDMIYIEVSGEIKEKDKTKVKDFVIKLTDEDRNIEYLKIDKKVYIGG